MARGGLRRLDGHCGQIGFSSMYNAGGGTLSPRCERGRKDVDYVRRRRGLAAAAGAADDHRRASAVCGGKNSAAHSRADERKWSIEKRREGRPYAASVRSRTFTRTLENRRALLPEPLDRQSSVAR